VTANRRLRVLVLTPDFPPVPGGIQVLVERVVRNAARLEPRVMTLAAPGAEEFDRHEPFDVRRVRSLLGSRRASNALLNAAALAEAWRFRPGVVLSAHIVMAPATRAIGDVLGAPAVQYLHADEAAARARLTAFAVRKSAAVVVVSKHTQRLALEAGADPARIHLIPPGVDVPERVRSDHDARSVVLTVARLRDEYKGHEILLAALPLICERVPDLLWVVVGDGPLRPRLERRAAEQGLAEHVRFLGAVPDDERDDWFRRAHVFAMPSRVPPGGGGEGFGIAYMEASAHELPVVAGNVGGALDAVVDGETGLLVDPTDPRAVADAVAGLLEDSERAAALGQKGAARARHFAWPIIAQRVEEVVLGAARRGRRNVSGQGRSS
jgi:phosphatidylinositol alpha-1,6-mannosyltransferase